MPDDDLIQELTNLAGDVPDRAAVLALEPITVEDVDVRMRRFLGPLGDVLGLVPRMDVLREADRTLFRLPLGAQVVGYSASGGVELKTGMRPMDNLIGPERDREELVGR